MIVSFLCLFLVVSWVNLWSVIGAFSDHTHLLFYCDAAIIYTIIVCLQKSCRPDLSEAMLLIKQVISTKLPLDGQSRRFSNYLEYMFSHRKGL